MFKHKNLSKNNPGKLRTYIIKYCGNVCNATALDIPQLDGSNPEHKLITETSEIIFPLDFHTYEPVEYNF